MSHSLSVPVVPIRDVPVLSGRVASHRLESSRNQPRRGTADDGDLVVTGVHALQSFESIYSPRPRFGPSLDLRFSGVVR